MLLLEKIWTKKVDHNMNQTDKNNSITKAELENIRNKYRQQRYDECLQRSKIKIKEEP